MNTVVMNAQEAPNFTAIKEKQQIAWGSGDYGKVGVTLQITGEELCEAMDLRSGQTVLDVAAGNGNVTLAAARRFCQVTSTDYIESLLAQGRVRADAEGFEVKFQKADAEKLPYQADTFDNVVSTFGVMFAPDQQSCAKELIRVCKPGGKIGLANWTPSGFIGQLFKIIGQYVPPPNGVSSPALWGTEQFLNDNFEEHVEKIQIRSRNFSFRYASPQHWVDVFRTYYGPYHKAILALDANKADELQQETLKLIAKLNRSKDGSMVVPSEYLEIVITK